MAAPVFEEKKKRDNARYYDRFPTIGEALPETIFRLTEVVVTRLTYPHSREGLALCSVSTPRNTRHREAESS